MPAPGVPRLDGPYFERAECMACEAIPVPRSVRYLAVPGQKLKRVFADVQLNLPGVNNFSGEGRWHLPTMMR
jgi:hypothetical protein